MPCTVLPGKNMLAFLSFALYCRRIIRVLFNFRRGEEVKDFESEINAVADWIVLLGADFVPEFKEKAEEQLRGGTRLKYGFGKKSSFIQYEHFLVFKNVAQTSNYQNRVAKLRETFLSLLNPAVDTETKKENAGICMEFLEHLWSECYGQMPQGKCAG